MGNDENNHDRVEPTICGIPVINNIIDAAKIALINNVLWFNFTLFFILWSLIFLNKYMNIKADMIGMIIAINLLSSTKCNQYITITYHSIPLKEDSKILYLVKCLDAK